MSEVDMIIISFKISKLLDGLKGPEVMAVIGGVLGELTMNAMSKELGTQEEILDAFTEEVKEDAKLFIETNNRIRLDEDEDEEVERLTNEAYEKMMGDIKDE